MKKGIWVVLSIAVFGAVMLGANFAEAQKAVGATLSSIACANDETIEFVDNGWKCVKMEILFNSKNLQILKSAPVECTARNIGAIYLNDNPRFDAVCVCAEYAGSHKFIELSGTGICQKYDPAAIVLETPPVKETPPAIAPKTPPVKETLPAIAPKTPPVKETPPVIEITPAEATQNVIDELNSIVSGNPGTPLAAKIQAASASVQTALSELNKTPPDNQAAAGNIEGAVGSLEDAIKDTGLKKLQGQRLIDQLLTISRELATNAISIAKIVPGSDAGKIISAKIALANGDFLREPPKLFGQFKSAAAMYKIAIAEAEGAII